MSSHLAPTVNPRSAAAGALARLVTLALAGAAPLATAADDAAIQRGQAVAARSHCATCHGPDFAGRGDAPRLAGRPENWLRESMEQLRVRAGPRGDSIMTAALYGLKDSDIADLAHYLANLPPAP
ncbi:c-type cytochrome [Ramlibacter humi]|uniref:C-type cytochrome n=1 Tax=Ramlibacter humi TaxID=2530451 RepID=A0A4Z0BJU8_9BURK|nr:c-type cytochrome [Ramlibacter humi]TFY98394.1 c-type cytochrome [Ramlibacter humi]